jgi:hypothetical protein
MQRAHTSSAPGLVVVLAMLVVVGSLATAFLLQARRRSPLPGVPQASAPAVVLAADRSAQASARNGLVAAITAYTYAHTFSTVTPRALERIEPDLTFTIDPSTSASVASVAMTDQRVGVAVRSDSGVCWLIAIDETGGGTTRYGTSGADPCTGELALGAGDRTW